MKYIKTYEAQITNPNEIAMKLIADFYSKFLPNIKFKKNEIGKMFNDRMYVMCGNSWLVKTFQPSNLRNYMQNNSIVHFYGDTVEMKTKYKEQPEILNIQMNLKLFFDNLLKDKLDNSDMIISNDMSCFNLDKFSEIIIKNKDQLTIENFEIFSNANKYNL